MQRAVKNILGRFGKSNMGHTHASPTPGDRKENIGEFLYEGLSLF